MHQGNMEAAVHSIRPELEGNIERQAQGVVACVYQGTQNLGNKLSEMIHAAQTDVHIVMTAIIWCSLSPTRGHRADEGGHK
jgi:hypothetical protein